MCSSGDKTAKAVEQSQAAFTNTLQAAFQQAFGANQAILQGLTAKLNDMLNNPKGFDAKTLTLLKTGASDAFTSQTQAALKGANAYMASHGSADLGSGVNSQIAGSILATGAAANAQGQSNIDIQNGLLANENYWKAIQGLTGVAQAYNPAGYASAANSSADSVADLSRSVLASQQAGWQNAMGIVSGIAGLGTAAVGAYKGLGFAGAAATGSGSGSS